MKATARQNERPTSRDERSLLQAVSPSLPTTLPICCRAKGGLSDGQDHADRADRLAEAVLGDCLGVSDQDGTREGRGGVATRQAKNGTSRVMPRTRGVSRSTRSGKVLFARGDRGGLADRERSPDGTWFADWPAGLC